MVRNTLKIHNARDARAFIAEAISRGWKVNLRPFMTDQEWCLAAETLWMTVHETWENKKVIDFSNRKRKLKVIKNQ